mmetsp:Transcript_403/g.1351  ORF Transcript_403/g.1351 Transcript_403/m.1351 type:complete len:297 (-) Transcript_403:708-1598(-)
MQRSSHIILCLLGGGDSLKDESLTRGRAAEALDGSPRRGLPVLADTVVVVRELLPCADIAHGGDEDADRGSGVRPHHEPGLAVWLARVVDEASDVPDPRSVEERSTGAVVVEVPLKVFEAAAAEELLAQSSLLSRHELAHVLHEEGIGGDRPDGADAVTAVGGAENLERVRDVVRCVVASAVPDAAADVSKVHVSRSIHAARVNLPFRSARTRSSYGVGAETRVLHVFAVRGNKEMRRRVRRSDEAADPFAEENTAALAEEPIAEPRLHARLWGFEAERRGAPDGGDWRLARMHDE